MCILSLDFFIFGSCPFILTCVLVLMVLLLLKAGREPATKLLLAVGAMYSSLLMPQFGEHASFGGKCMRTCICMRCFRRQIKYMLDDTPFFIFYIYIFLYVNRCHLHLTAHTYQCTSDSKYVQMQTTNSTNRLQ